MSAPSRARPTIPRPSIACATSAVSALLLILALMLPVKSIQAQSSASQVVSWVHIGDLHMVDTTLSNYTDLQTIVSDINSSMKDGINFAYLPGDNANDGTEAEYQLIHSVIQNLQVPLKAVPGDHDLKSGGTSLFKQYIYPKNPDAFDIGNYRFLLLNSFDLQNQMSFITSELDAAKAADMQSVLMFHEFDVNQCCSSLQSLIQKDSVILVDTGHTHTNVLANDGHSIYAATRSTGQDSEGPVGFSLVSLDHGIVSWRFEPLGQWPLVSITSPADEGLIINPSQVVKGTVSIHAKVFSDAAIQSVSYQIDGGSKVGMSDRGSNLWSASWDSSGTSNGTHTITVTVTDAKGQTGTDQNTALVNQSGSYSAPSRSFGPEGNALPANPNNGLLGATGAGGGPGKGGKPAPGKGPKQPPAGGPPPCTTTTPIPTPIPTATPKKKGPPCGAKPGTKHPVATTNVVTSGNGLSASFTVTSTSDNPGTGEVLFGSGPGCLGLVETATSDRGAGTTNHAVLVTGNDLAGTVGDNGIQPGATYWYEVETISPSGREVDNNGGACYSITIPSHA